MIARTRDSFITRPLIFEKLHHDKSWVRRTWTNINGECYAQFGNGRPKIFFQESKTIITSASADSGSSSRKIAREILKETGLCVSDETVHAELHRQGLKPFHEIAKPLRTNMHIEDPKWLAEYVVQGISLIA